MMDYKHIDKEFELDVKRFHLPIKIYVECPNCFITHAVDLEDSYLSYPTLNKKIEQYCNCNECDTEFEFDITLKVSEEVNTETRKL